MPKGSSPLKSSIIASQSARGETHTVLQVQGPKSVDHSRRLQRLHASPFMAIC